MAINTVAPLISVNNTNNPSGNGQQINSGTIIAAKAVTFEPRYFLIKSQYSGVIAAFPSRNRFILVPLSQVPPAIVNVGAKSLPT